MSHTKLRKVGHLFMYVKEVELIILNNGCVYIYIYIRTALCITRSVITGFFRGPRRPRYNGVAV